MNAFKDATQSDGFGDIIPDVIEVIENLPGIVMDLRSVGRDMLKVIGEYTDMPPVVNKVNQLILKVTRLFGDIRTDVMEMYNVRTFKSIL